MIRGGPNSATKLVPVLVLGGGGGHDIPKRKLRPGITAMLKWCRVNAY